MKLLLVQEEVNGYDSHGIFWWEAIEGWTPGSASNPALSKTFALIHLTFRSHLLDNVFQLVFYIENQDFLVLDLENRVLLSRRRQEVGSTLENLGYAEELFSETEDSFLFTGEDRDLLVSTYPIHKTGWKAVRTVKTVFYRLLFYSRNFRSSRRCGGMPVTTSSPPARAIS